jgi:hypothetical protein
MGVVLERQRIFLELHGRVDVNHMSRGTGIGEHDQQNESKLVKLAQERVGI